MSINYKDVDVKAEGENLQLLEANARSDDGIHLERPAHIELNIIIREDGDGRDLLLHGADADSPGSRRLEPSANLGLNIDRQVPSSSSCCIEMDVIRMDSIENAEETKEAERVKVKNVKDGNVEVENVEAASVEQGSSSEEDELSKLWDINTNLLIAIANQDNNKVISLLEAGTSPNATFENAYVTACHLAAFMNEEALQILLEADAKIERFDCNGLTPLHYAASSESARNVAMILGFPKDLKDRVASVNRSLTAEEREEIDALKPAITEIANRRRKPYKPYDYTPDPLPKIPVRWKAKKDERIMTERMERVCRIVLSIAAYSSALHAASNPANPQCLRLLLAAGADPNLKDSNGATPLDVVGVSCPISRVHFYVESIQILREYGGELSTAECGVLEVALRMHSLEALTLLLDAGAPISQRNSSGDTPLHVCVDLQLKDHLQVLCNYSCPITNCRAVNVTDRFGNTVLHRAICNVNTSQCWSEGLSVALDARADINLTNDGGDTPLHLAAFMGYYDCVQKILEYDTQKLINLRQENNCGRSAFTNAIGSGNVDIVKYMTNIENELDVFDCKVYNVTPLEHTAKCNHHELFIFILNSPISKLETEVAFRLINIFAKHDRSEMFNEFIKSNKMGNTIKILLDTSTLFPLHEAIINGNRNMIVALLQNGANLSQKDASEQTALGLIMQYITKPTKFLEEIFDSYIDSNKKNIYDKDCMITIDYSVLIPFLWTNNEPVREMNVLDALIETGNLKGQRSLLAHPFVESFLHLKWNKCSKLIYLFITIYALFLISLNIFLVSDYYYIDNKTEKILPFFDPDTWAICILVSLGLVIIMECFIWNLKKRWMFEWETWVKFSSILLGATLPIISLATKSEGAVWCRVIASLTTVSSWVNMMIYLSWTPTFGYYMQMYGKVSMNVLKIMVIFAIPIICFAISFMILFHAKAPFDGPWAALFKTIVMMTSEFEYKDLAESKNISAILLFRVVFLLFILFVSIVLMNLITGVAVNDMQALTRDGNLRRLEKQVDRLCMLEVLFNRKPFTYFHLIELVQVPYYVGIRQNTNIFNSNDIKEKIMNRAQKMIDLEEKKADVTIIKTKLDEIIKNMPSKDDTEKMLNDLVQKTVEKSVNKILEILPMKYTNNGIENAKNNIEMDNDQTKYLSDCVEKTVAKAVDAFLEVLAKKNMEKA